MTPTLDEIPATDRPGGRIPDTALVSFKLSPPRHGWIRLTVSADEITDQISCSHVYDPFQDIVTLIARALSGMPGCVEVNEEGRTTIIRIDVEPGELVGRLRVFEPGEWGEVETSKVDARVDVAQLAHAWHSAFAPFVATYDPDHWTPSFPPEDEVAPRTLAEIDTSCIEAELEMLAWLPRAPRKDDDELLTYVQRRRARYAAAQLAPAAR